MEYKNSVREVVNFIEKIERELSLLNYKIDGVYFWKLIRFPIFDKILANDSVMNNSFNHKKINIYFFMQILKQEINIVSKDALKYAKKSDILIMKSPRKTRYDNQFRDIYTYFIERELRKNTDLKVETFEIGIQNQEILKDNNSKFAMESRIIQKIKQKKLKVNINKAEKELLMKIQQSILLEYGLEIYIENFVDKVIRSFKVKQNYYKKLFLKTKPKTIFLVCSYGNEAMISAAQDLNIKVVEIQHGTMSKYHVGYDFGDMKKIPYFPDELLLFGEYWKEITDIPLQSQNIKVIGYPYLGEQLKNYKDVEKQKNTLIFLSQPTIARPLIEIALNFAKKNEKYKIIYKLHPNEYSIWKKDYPKLLEAIKLNNFVLVDDQKKNLHELLSYGEYQIGVYSTAIYEGLELGCKTVLIDLPGLEEVEFLIDQKLALLVKNENELLESINNFNAEYYKRGFVFKNIDKFEEEVKKIIGY